METIIKELPIPKEVIEVQEAIAPPEESGVGVVGYGIGVVILAVVAVGLYKNYKNCQK